MSNLKLVPDDPTPIERLLLDASRAEQPSDEHKARLRAVLGIGLPLSGPFAAPPPASGMGPQAAAASATAATKSTLVAKVALGAAVAAVLGAFAFTQLERDEGATLPAPAAKPAPAPEVEPVVTETLPEISPLPPLEAPAALPRSAAKGEASSPAANDDLSEQIRLIEAARTGVAGRDAKSALAALDAYAQKFPRGSFGQEAMVLRIKAVDQAGDSSRATAMAKSFVTRFPNSPHVARVKAIAERGDPR